MKGKHPVKENDLRIAFEGLEALDDLEAVPLGLGRQEGENALLEPQHQSHFRFDEQNGADRLAQKLGLALVGEPHRVDVVNLELARVVPQDQKGRHARVQAGRVEGDGLDLLLKAGVLLLVGKVDLYLEEVLVAKAEQKTGGQLGVQVLEGGDEPRTRVVLHDLDEVDFDLLVEGVADLVEHEVFVERSHGQDVHLLQVEDGGGDEVERLAREALLVQEEALLEEVRVEHQEGRLALVVEVAEHDLAVRRNEADVVAPGDVVVPEDEGLLQVEVRELYLRVQHRGRVDDLLVEELAVRAAANERGRVLHAVVLVVEVEAEVQRELVYQLRALLVLGLRLRVRRVQRVLLQDVVLVVVLELLELRLHRHLLQVRVVDDVQQVLVRFFD